LGKWSRIIPLIVVLLTTLVYAGVVDERIFSDGFEKLAHPCAPISLGLSNPDILEEVPILGFEAVNETTRLFAEGATTRVQLPIGQAEDQSFFFAAPIHPDLAGEAGSVWMVLETGGELCDLGFLSLPALAPASATDADEILALLEELTIQLLESYAFGIDAFDPLIVDNSAMDLSLAMLHRALLYDGSPTKLSTVRAQVAALPEAERILMGRIFAEADVRNTVEELLEIYGDFALQPAMQAATSARSFAISGYTAAATQQPVSTGDCVPASFERVSIIDSGELSSAMLTAQQAGESLARESTRRKVASTVFGAVAFAGPVGQAVAVAGGAVLLVQESADENSAKLLPSSLSDTVIEATVNPINEDYMDVPGQLRPRWRAFTTAHSEGLNLSKRVLDIALKSAGAIPLAAPAAAPLAAFDTASAWTFQAQPDEASCFTIPPHTWPRISVSDEQWLANPPIVSGSSIVLVQTIEMDPVDIGITNIEVRLSPSLFPCSNCTLASTSADIDVEVRQKNVVFTRFEFPIETESSTVVVTGSIQNASRPESWGFEAGAGVTFVESSAPDPSFSLTYQGEGKPERFPVAVTVRSNSRTLPSGTDSREGSTVIVLKPTVTVFQEADGCVGTESVVTLMAEVTGLENKDVSWNEPPGANVTPTSGTEATFSASAPGTYTVTAASVVVPEAMDSIDIIVSECDIEMFFWGTALAETPSSTEDNPPCGSGSSPDGQLQEAMLGTEPLFMDTGTFRNPVNWSSGGSFPLNLDLQDQVASNYYIDQTCHNTSIATSGHATGSLSTVGGSNTLDVDLDVGMLGGCQQVTNDLRDCTSGASVVGAATTFTFEHQGEGTQSYEYSVNLQCTLSEPTLSPGLHNVTLSLAVLDEAGSWNDGNYFAQALDLPSLLAFTRAAGGGCYAGQPLSIQETFNFLNIPPMGSTDPMAPGQKYTVGFIVVVSAAPTITEDPMNLPNSFSDQGTMTGTISLRPAATP